MANDEATPGDGVVDAYSGDTCMAVSDPLRRSRMIRPIQWHIGPGLMAMAQAARGHGLVLQLATRRDQGPQWL